MSDTCVLDASAALALLAASQTTIAAQALASRDVALLGAAEDGGVTTVDLR